MTVSPTASERAPDLDAPGAGDAVGPAPAVVAVVVAHDPGWWFEETLASLAAQDYPNLSVLVVDAGSEDAAAVRETTARVVPGAHLRRLETNPGFPIAADEVLTAVQGASFYLFCHDDVRLGPDVVRVLVEEAYRSNAGVVGPKLVAWDDHRRLLSVGMGADRFGHPSAYVERGDLDQAQHDAVRDVFYVPGAATLVRADLFAALGGYDPEITFHGDDLDLCWRAHVAGARVVVAPAARVAHLEALGVRRPVDDRRRLQTRHRLRVLRVADTFGTRLRVLPVAFLLALLEILQSVVLGRFRHARDLASAWAWNVRTAGSARRRRAALGAVRQAPDRDVRHLQTSGSARLSAYLRGQLGREDPLSGAGRELVSNLRASRATTPVVVWGLVGLFWVVAARELLVGSIPAVGDLPSLLGPGQSLSRWVSGYQALGLGTTSPAPTGLGLFGALGVVFLGAVGMLRKVLILGPIVVGAVGMWRLTKPVGSRRSRIVATVTYVAVPVAANALATGRWGGLVAYAVVPWVLSQLARASGIAPFGELGGSAGPGVRPRPLLHRVVAVGVLTALAVTVVPAAAVLVAGCGLALVVGGLLCGQTDGTGRVLAASFGGAAVGVLLHLPWSLSFFSGWEAVVGTTSTAGRQLDLGAVLRFGSGPYGAVFGALFLVTAALPLLIGRRWRLGWAVRAWALAVAGFAATWVAGQGWLPGDLPTPELLLAPAGVGIALAAGLGMTAFEVDLPDYHFGWRQIVSLLAAAAFVVAMVPALGVALSGRYQLPGGDYDHTLQFLDQQVAAAPFRTLWLGDAGVLPLSGWRLDAPGIDDLGPNRTLAYATSAEGTPTVAEQWAGQAESPTTQIADAVRVAGEGGTTRLGSLLAPMGIRYLVVPLGPAPDPWAGSSSYDPANLVAALEAQLDLSEITVNPGVRVFENAAWGPQRAQLPAGTKVSQGGSSLADQTLPALRGAPVALPDSKGFASYGGSVGAPSVVYLADAGGSRWKLSVAGRDVPRTPALGWASAFTVEGQGAASLRFDTPVTRWLALLGQVLLWVLAVGYLLRTRVREDESDAIAAAEAEARHVVVRAGEAPPARRRRRGGPTRAPVAGSPGGGPADLADEGLELPTMAVPVVRLEPESEPESKPEPEPAPDGEPVTPPEDDAAAPDEPEAAPADGPEPESEPGSEVAGEPASEPTEPTEATEPTESADEPTEPEPDPLADLGALAPDAGDDTSRRSRRGRRSRGKHAR